MAELPAIMIEPAREGELIEALAAQAHTSWSGWVDYMFSQCQVNADGGLTIPTDKVNRWRRQSGTPYDKLPENERGSDRVEANNILASIQGKMVIVGAWKIGGNSGD